jgi:hypothetical protein
MRALLLLVFAACATDPAAGYSRQERRHLAMCLDMYCWGARIQRRECVAAHPDGVDKFEEDGRE